MAIRTWGLGLGLTLGQQSKGWRHHAFTARNYDQKLVLVEIWQKLVRFISLSFFIAIVSCDVQFHDNRTLTVITPSVQQSSSNTFWRPSSTRAFRRSRRYLSLDLPRRRFLPVEERTTMREDAEAIDREGMAKPTQSTPPLLTTPSAHLLCF